MNRNKLLDEPDQERELEQSTDTETNKDSYASLFVKVGIVVLSMIMIVGFGIRIIPTAVTVTNLSTKNDLPIYSVNLEETKISLSFDAAWTNEDTSEILDILDKCKVKATFFMTGEWVDKYPKDVKAIAAAGHDLGNHSENHKRMTDLPKNECEEEIMTAHNRVMDLTGIEMKLFRAPYGDYNNMIVGTARECGYYTIQWNVDSMDWKDYGVDSILGKTVENRKLGNGSIILLHVGAKYTPEALEKIIVGLQEKGYEIVPVSQLIYTGDYKVDQMGRQMEK
ncbi:MAG: hypothetical protein K0R34_3192 [Herbinix sp.]|jgi:polysaccharide deacetylase family sporulation protein PdaB|nr:hypothetical protein [Herbinix sp.]